MRLTTYTDYALRVLMRLALQPEHLTTIADIAKDYGISPNHLMKVVHQLGAAGFIETVRGKNGGLRLGRSPGEINVETWCGVWNMTWIWCPASRRPMPAS